MSRRGPFCVAVAVTALALLAGYPLAAKEKLTPEDRIEITRSLTAEYATVKIPLPRSKKALPFDNSGSYDQEQWAKAAREHGPAARAGDLVQITKVTFESKRMVFEINGGFRGGRKWYERIQIGVGTRSTPVNMGSRSYAPGGTKIALLFSEGLPSLEASELKKLLSPVLDFEQRSAAEQYVESLPEPIQAAIKEERAIEDMDRDMVLLALGKPDRKVRETKDGVELEDWIYGEPPGKIVFVTFQGSKVIRVKEVYAGLGGSVAPPLPPK